MWPSLTTYTMDIFLKNNVLQRDMKATVNGVARSDESTVDYWLDKNVFQGDRYLKVFNSTFHKQVSTFSVTTFSFSQGY